MHDDTSPSDPSVRDPYAALSGLALVVAAAFALRTIAQGALWGHLAMGRWIVDHGMPHEAVGSFLSIGRPWIDSTWLYDILVYRLHAIGGLSAITLLHAVAVALAFAVLGMAVARSVRALALAWGLLFAVWLASPALNADPLTLAMLPAAVMLALFERARPHVALPGLALSQVLWTNLHPSFPLGLALAAAYVLAAAGRWMNPDPDTPRAVAAGRLAWRSGLLVLLAAATLINPYGLRIWSPAVAYLVSPGQVLFENWGAPFLSQFVVRWPNRLLLGALVVGLAGFAFSRKRLPTAWVTLALLGVALIWRSSQWLPMFALLFFPMIALGFSSTGEELGQVLQRTAPGVARTMRGVFAGLLIAAALASLWGVGSQRVYAARAQACAFGLGEQSGAFPSALLRRLNETAPDLTILNGPREGGYLQWARPDRPVFLDHRILAHGRASYSAWATFLADMEDEGRPSLPERMKADALLLNVTEPGVAMAVPRLEVEQGWAPCWFDGAYVLMLTPERAAALGDALGAMRKESLALLEDARGRMAARLSDGGRLSTPLPMAGAAALFSALGLSREAGAVYDLLTRNTPNMSGGWTGLGIARARMGQFAPALYALDRAIELNPNDGSTWLWKSRVLGALGRDEDGVAAMQRAMELRPKPAVP